ncbi:MAG: flavin prenyltransferase UbiX [Pirellulales bacterium]
MPSPQPPASSPCKRLVFAITGASGAVYARRLLAVLLDAGCEVHLSISPAGRQVIAHELGVELDLELFRGFDGEYSMDAALPPVCSPGAKSPGAKSACEPTRGRLVYHHYRDLMSPIASGSFLTDGMVICPCSGGTLSAVVHGASTGLIHRAADVHLKERRKLILVPRETPLSLVQLDNMRRAAEVGAIVLPASPGFYHEPRSIDDLVDFVVARICDQLGVAHRLMRRWGEA